MDHAELIAAIAARVNQRLEQEEGAIHLSGKAITAKKVRDAYEQGYRTVCIPAGALVTAEAQDYAYEKRMTIQRIE